MMKPLPAGNVSLGESMSSQTKNKNCPVGLRALNCNTDSPVSPSD
jgi:hypothetical protein